MPTTLPSVPASSESQNTHGSSKSWIAGAVIGPVVALAIIATLAFWIWKLRRQQGTAKERVVHYDTTKKAELDPNSHPAIMNEVHGQPLVEMPGARGFPELPGSQMR